MTDMGDDFRAMRDYKRLRKNERGAKFNAARSFIKDDAASIGIAVDPTGQDGAWRFTKNGDWMLDWYPESGKTDSGAYFGTWPELKAHLQTIEVE